MKSTRREDVTALLAFLTVVLVQTALLLLAYKSLRWLGVPPLYAAGPSIAATIGSIQLFRHVRRRRSLDSLRRGGSGCGRRRPSGASDRSVR